MTTETVDSDQRRCPRTGAPCATVDLFVRVLPDDELSRARRHAVKPIDTCVAGVIIALNGVGIGTIGSCCGHGTADMSVLLDDGRELLLGRPR